MYKLNPHTFISLDGQIAAFKMSAVLSLESVDCVFFYVPKEAFRGN